MWNHVYMDESVEDTRRLVALDERNMAAGEVLSREGRDVECLCLLLFKPAIFICVCVLSPQLALSLWSGGWTDRCHTCCVEV